jgi:hypothetical protein
MTIPEVGKYLAWNYPSAGAHSFNKQIPVFAKDLVNAECHFVQEIEFPFSHWMSYS